MTNLKIGLHMIVKEDIDTIERCLKSCQDFVDYMVIAVDSKPESDQTYEICKKYAGDGAYRQEWKHDFGEARNDALKRLLEIHPDTTYIFWLDGDDRLANVEDGGSSFSALRERLAAEQPYVVSAPYVYNTDEAVQGLLPNLQFFRHRLWKHIPNSPPIRVWEGAAHECDVEAGSSRGLLSTSKYGDAVVWRDLIVVHKKEPLQKKKTLRNIKILESAHKKDPVNTRTMFYLGREYRDYGLKEKAILMLQKYVLKSKFIEEKYDALMNIAYMFRDLQDPHSAEKFSKQAFELKPELALAPAFLGELYMNYKMYGMAKPWLSYAIHAPHGSILFDEVSSRTYVPHKLISMCFLHTKDLENAKRHHQIAKQMAPHDSGLRYNDVWLGDGSTETYSDCYQPIISFIDEFSCEGFEQATPEEIEQERKRRTQVVIKYAAFQSTEDCCLLALGNSTYELEGLNNVFLLKSDLATEKENGFTRHVKFLLISPPLENFTLTVLNTIQFIGEECLIIIENFKLVERNLADILKSFKNLIFLRNYSKQLGIGLFLLKID
jgi:tetratricopeptide (TPR) repeat protein